MGNSVESGRQIPRWSVKRIRARRASQGASQPCLQFERLLEPGDSQQAQLATHGDILPGPALRESTYGTDLPSTPPASRNVEEFFVPDSPDEVWSGGKDSSRRRDPLKWSGTLAVSTKFEELVVPDSPEETWTASKLSRTPLASTNFEELIVPESPEETGAWKDPSHRPGKLRRTTSPRKFHQKPVGVGNRATLGRGCSESLSPLRTTRLNFKDTADPSAPDHSQHYDGGFPVLPAAGMTSSTIADQPLAIDLNQDLDHETTEVVRAPDETQTSRDADGLPTSLLAPNVSGSSEKPLTVSSSDMSNAGSILRDAELDNCPKSQGIVVSQEEFHRGSPTLYVPDTEEDAGAPVSPFSMTSSMLAPSCLVLEKPRLYLRKELVNETGIRDSGGTGFQKAEILIGDRAKNVSNAGRMTLSALSTAIGGRVSVSSLNMQKARNLLSQVPSENLGYEEGKAPFVHDDKENNADEGNSLHLEYRQLSRDCEFAPDWTRKLRPLSEIQAEGSNLQSAHKGEKFGPVMIGKLDGSGSSQWVQSKEIPENSACLQSRSSRRTKTVSDVVIQAAKVRLVRPGEGERSVFPQAAEQSLVDPNGNFTFKTGSGKTVAISSEAMEKAKALLADCSKTTGSPRESTDSGTLVTPTKAPSPSRTCRTPSVRKFAISSGAMSRARALLAPVEGVEDPRAITSFVTGSGKPVSSSFKALEKVRALFGEEFEWTPVNALNDSVATTSLVTGSGKSVSISSKGLDKAGSLLGEELAETALVKAFDDPVAITSFVTGSGKSVSISSKSLEKVREIFGDEFEETAPVKALNDSVATTSFVTGSGKSVSISSKGLDKARAFWGEELEETAPVKAFYDPVAITSFVTGSGKSVSISSKSLQKVRASFGEEFEETAPVKALNDSVATTSFVTGSGKSVSISSKSLEKVRAMFGEESQETTIGTSQDRVLAIDGRLSEGKSGRPSLITNKFSPVLNPYKPDLAGILSAKLTSTVGGEYQWRNVRAFKPPRIRKHSDDTGNSRRDISTSIFGAISRGNERHSLNSVTVDDGEQQLQPLVPAYLKDGRIGWMRLREYIEGTPANEVSPSLEIRLMTPDAADNYRILHATEDGTRESVGTTEIWKVLLNLGADPLYSTKEWVANHYKWIIWKLASSERKHPRQAARKCLTLDRVLEELKYRYDTELSGRRSSIRKITEGDASASRAMVLLVSAIRHDGDDNGALEEHTGRTSSSGDTAKIEVTDGWYRLNAVLDAPLTKYLRKGKLNVGQKIKVCGATLCSCPDSTSPLEAFRDSFLTLHVNGTYRARQNHRLGFCRRPLPPLAFRCIKPDGGVVSKTYVGVARVYPILFQEKSADGSSIVRSVRAEELASTQFELRRAKVAEEAILKLENSRDPSESQEEKDEEGYELFDAVERAAEPDVLMAELTPEQLKAFVVYQAKRETSRQATIENAAKEALQDAGLYSRNVTRVLKVRVTGLQWRGREVGEVDHQRKDGMISMWDVSDEQNIVEGSVYCVSGLRPVTWSSSSNRNQLHLQAYRSTCWRHVPEAIYEKRFLFPYTSRAPTRLSDMEEKLVSREFDVAAKVLVVDRPFSSGSRRNQWVFVADGSTTRNSPEDAWDETQILAVKVSLPALAFAPVETSLVGSVVGFCNLVQRPKDHDYHWWVAEASDLSIISSTLTSHPTKHLQTAASCVLEWDKSSPWEADMLRNHIQTMISQGAQR